jgi:hypothetical protein
MVEDLSDSVSGSTELVFPDDVTGTETYRLQKRKVYDAEDVREELDSDVPQYGKWLPVELNGDEAWLVAPSELRSELVDQEIRTGERFTIDQMTKSGRGQSDPYEVSITLPDRQTAENQSSLSET